MPLARHLPARIPGLLLPVLAAIGLAVVAPPAVRAQAPSNFVLELMGPHPSAPGTPVRLAGNHKMLRWSNVSYKNGDKLAWTQSTLVPTGEPPGLSYSLDPISPGYRATEGIYALTADFGVTARISPTAAISPTYATRTLVFQTATMLNWPGGWTLEDYFNYDHASHFDEHSSATGGMDDYNVNSNLLALALIELDDGTLYRGGPVLKYTLSTGHVAYRHATSHAMLNNGVRMDNLGQTGEWSGTYFSFAWQWDLSDIEGIITDLEVSAPLIVHSSTIGVQMDVSDVHSDALATFAPPPPSQLVATPGDSAVRLSWEARSGAAGYYVKRSTTDGGPYTLVATVPGGATTSYSDTGLTNGTTYHYVVSSYNDGGQGEDSIQRSATPAVPGIAAWRLSYFGTAENTGDAADEADPDGDGLPNLLEYALRRHPLVPDSTGVVTLGQTSTATKRLTLTFPRLGDGSLVYVVEATDDLASGRWDRVFLSTGIAGSGGYAEGTSGVNSVIGNATGTYTVWDNVVISAKTRRFLRLTVSTATTTVKDAPRGFQVVDLPAGTSSLGLPLLNEAVYAAKVESVSGGVLTLAGSSGFNIGARLSSHSAYPFYLEVISGPLEGERLDLDVAATIAAANRTVVLSADTTRNTLPADRFAELVGNAVALRRHVTLTQIQSLLGAALQGGTAATADAIQIMSDGAFRRHYLAANGETWRRTGTSADLRYTPIEPGEGILVNINSANSLAHFGAIRANQFRKNLKSGLQYNANPWPVYFSPADVGGYVDAGEEITMRWVGDNVAANADSIQIFDNEAFVRYYLAANGTTWRRTGTSTNFAQVKLLKPEGAWLLNRNNQNNSYLLEQPYE